MFRRLILCIVITLFVTSVYAADTVEFKHFNPFTRGLAGTILFKTTYYFSADTYFVLDGADVKLYVSDVLAQTWTGARALLTEAGDTLITEGGDSLQWN